MRAVVVATAASAVASAAASAASAVLASDLVPAYEWAAVNYTWTNASQYSAYVAAGLYKPQNCIITGLKYYAGTPYVTVPRWMDGGVPATLNTISVVDGVPLLQPYPSWAFNDMSNPAALRYTQSMEIQPDGLMWILDVGRLNIFAPPASVVNGPPKLVLWSIPDNATVQTYLFTNDVASYSASFLNDLVVDMTDGVAYISDAGTGAIVVYDRVANAARRFADATTQADPSVNMTINGQYYPNIDTPTDGIALSPDRAKLFYCALRGKTLYMLPTSALRDFSASNAQLSAMVVTVGLKPPSDGLTFTDTGILYFGSLTGDAVLQWDSSQPLSTQTVAVSNFTTMQWPDTFAFAGPGLLAFTTNRLQLFFAGTMDFSGASGANMRVFVLPIAGNSYLDAQAPFAPRSRAEDTSKAYVAVAVLGSLFGVSAVIIGILAYVAFARRARDADAQSQASPMLVDDRMNA